MNPAEPSSPNPKKDEGSAVSTPTASPLATQAAAGSTPPDLTVDESEGGKTIKAVAVVLGVIIVVFAATTMYKRRRQAR
ncbi:MAG: hypothetical protein OXH86_13880 [Acidimicrobiaceae bacterium]|nr:hypothetical protein [Acidimicrobiaceae bacterium]